MTRPFPYAASTDADPALAAREVGEGLAAGIDGAPPPLGLVYVADRFASEIGHIVDTLKASTRQPSPPC